MSARGRCPPPTRAQSSSGVGASRGRGAASGVTRQKAASDWGQSQGSDPPRCCHRHRHCRHRHRDERSTSGDAVKLLPLGVRVGGRQTRRRSRMSCSSHLWNINSTERAGQALGGLKTNVPAGYVLQVAPPCPHLRTRRAHHHRLRLWQPHAAWSGGQRDNRGVSSQTAARQSPWRWTPTSPCVVVAAKAPRK